ncbi:hypothetical protein GM30_12805 [Trabulsiella odontotermitis]|nr:hypothetical protein GM30_12805 [Trabulsiella odontotermitis]
MGAMNQLLWRQTPVRRGSVAMQVVNYGVIVVMVTQSGTRYIGGGQRNIIAAPPIFLKSGVDFIFMN